MRLVPNLFTFALRSPFAESVSPTEAMIAATPIIGPRSKSKVRTLRANNPLKATRRRSLKVLMAVKSHP